MTGCREIWTDEPHNSSTVQLLKMTGTSQNAATFSSDLISVVGSIGVAGIAKSVTAFSYTLPARQALATSKRRIDFIGSADGKILPLNRKSLESGFQKAGFPASPTDSPDMQYILPNENSIRVMNASGPTGLRASFTYAKGSPINIFTGKPPQPPKGLSSTDRLKYVRK